MKQTEKQIQIEVILKVMVVIVCASLYSVGGMTERTLLRKILAPTICALSMWWFSKDWRCLFQMPMMFIGMSFGYGASSLIGKIVRRLIFAIINGCTSSTYNIIKIYYILKEGNLYNPKFSEGLENTITLVGYQVAALTGVYILFGVFNPLQSARAEEIVLGVFIYLIPIMSCCKQNTGK